MLALDPAAIPPTSSCALVARTSPTAPDFVVADRVEPRFIAARWRRRQAHLAEPVTLPDHLLSYCLRGSAVSTVVVDGVATRVAQRAGSATFLPAGHAAQWLLDAPAELVHVHFYVMPGALRDGSTGSAARALERLQGPVRLRDPWLDGFFRLLVAEYEARRGRAATGVPSGFLEQLGALLVQHLAGLHAPRDATPNGASRISPLRPFIVRRIEAFVEAHLERELRLDDLAAVASMSVDHFVRSFKEATGATPHRYLLERRLERARTLLHGSADSIAAISRRCGFGATAHFSATFHAHCGMTPTQYRRRC